MIPDWNQVKAGVITFAVSSLIEYFLGKRGKEDSTKPASILEMLKKNLASMLAGLFGGKK